MSVRICTTNENKVREFERMLGFDLRPVALDLEEIQTLDTVAACRNKGVLAFAALGEPVVVDDTGFELAALDGFPGALVRWAIDAGGTRILHRMLPEGVRDTASVVTAVAYVDGAGVQIFVGRLDGRVIAEPRGTNGFGFNAVFVPSGEDRTLAEMSDAEKDRISPRGQALRDLAAFLREQAR
ncbi:non-canonical purine NTP pyrophosphatase [Sphingomonas populi]|uniref:Non-canonical purine NTP pyrophosphatase n=1 Tax=Sphingomonas populi TaxID=2484750 RepID=A0A4Q6XS50_9SPHN|nr:non-canonical purine NTP pyrophosphatase [Sphingomonas populi]RZF63283.1 non-canonical purine NTP pyrophosphatase [Sphingomonas populi]